MTFPTISHFFESCTGIFIPLPIQTFGFFIALAFLIGHYFIKQEFLRLEKTRILNSITLKSQENIFFILIDYFFNGILGFFFRI